MRNPWEAQDPQESWGTVGGSGILRNPEEPCETLGGGSRTFKNPEEPSGGAFRNPEEPQETLGKPKILKNHGVPWGALESSGILKNRAKPWGGGLKNFQES